VTVAAPRALCVLLCAAACALAAGAGSPASAAGEAPPGDERGKLRTATFAGGCFWCMQPPFDRLAGVVSTTAGYTGGTKRNPTYEEVSAGGTGHAESVRVLYDPAKVGYERLLEVFWHNIDPLARDRQFCDGGHQYRSAIFWHDEEQRRAAEASKAALEASGRLKGPIVTEIVPAGDFWPAEDYHQSYYRKNPIRYKFYRFNCGRDARLKELWGEAAAE
jgi:peptide-methionine (S)-S-oxide reductase